MPTAHVFMHAPYEDPGAIAHWLADRGIAVGMTRWYADEVPPPPHEVERLIVMGGPMGVYEHDRHLWLVAELDWLTRYLELPDRTALGVCLGAQLLAAALGARVEPHRVREIGWFPVQLTDAGRHHPLFADFPATFVPLHWHGDTFEIPDEAAWIARSEGCPHQAFVWRDRVVGLQFHLEATPELVEAFLVNGYPEDADPAREPYLAPAERIREATVTHAEEGQRLLRSLLDRLYM